MSFSNGKRIILVVAVIAVVLVAFFFWPSEEAPTGVTIRIITRHDTAIWNAFEPAFLATDYAKDHNVVDVRWVAPDQGLWEEVIEAGGVDVAWGGGPTLFDTLIDSELLDPLIDSEVLGFVSMINDTIGGAVMKRLGDDGEIYWVAAAISSFGFTVNNAFLDQYDLPTPRRWTDLANRTYGSLLPKETISMGNAPDTTSNTRIYEIILQAFEWDEAWSILTRMAGNAKMYSGSGISVDVQGAVEAGEVGVALSIDFYGYTTLLRNPDCEYVIPEGESIINGDPIALVKGSENRDAAEAFIAYVLSPEGQSQWFYESTNRMPVVEEAFDTELGQSRPDLYDLFQITISNIGIVFDDELALSFTDAIMLYFQSVLTDAHEELKEAWKTLIDAVETGKISESKFEDLALQLGEPVQWTEDSVTYKFTMEYAQSINTQIRTDPAFANQMAAIWREAARLQYEDVAESA